MGKSVSTRDMTLVVDEVLPARGAQASVKLTIRFDRADIAALRKTGPRTAWISRRSSRDRVLEHLELYDAAGRRLKYSLAERTRGFTGEGIHDRLRLIVPPVFEDSPGTQHTPRNSRLWCPPNCVIADLSTRLRKSPSISAIFPCREPARSLACPITPLVLFVAAGGRSAQGTRPDGARGETEIGPTVRAGCGSRLTEAARTQALPACTKCREGRRPRDWRAGFGPLGYDPARPDDAAVDGPAQNGPGCAQGCSNSRPT